MRVLALILSLAAVSLAGCGSAAQHSATQPPTFATTTERAASHVFTVPAKLPPRAHAPRPRASISPHQTDTAPAASGGAPTDAQVQQDLARALGGGGANRDLADQAGLGADGMAVPPPSAPAKVAAIITAGNQVARAPYRYGGGHGGVGGKETWVDSAYDCSGSVSFALASAGLVDRQMDSTSFESWGRPGPGKWVTVFANADHAFMVVAGLRFDTIERARTGTRWGVPYAKVTGFVARHPSGL